MLLPIVKQQVFVTKKIPLGPPTEEDISSLLKSVIQGTWNKVVKSKSFFLMIYTFLY